VTDSEWVTTTRETEFSTETCLLNPTVRVESFRAGPGSIVYTVIYVLLRVMELTGRVGTPSFAPVLPLFVFQIPRDGARGVGAWPCPVGRSESISAYISRDVPVEFAG